MNALHYCLEGNNDNCPICKKSISSECYECHGLKLYKFLLVYGINFYCSICKEFCDSYYYISFHYHDMKDICIWCRKSWNTLNETPDNVKHLIPCYLEFMKNVLPRHIPSYSSNKCSLCDGSIKMVPAVLLSCQHKFHMACISDLILNYHVNKCPICFRSINHQGNLMLKRFGYTIEKMEMDRILSHYLINVPSEYTKSYFTIMNTFYEKWLFDRQIYEFETFLYPNWTYERFLIRFKYILDKQEPLDEFEKKIKLHFEHVMIDLMHKKEINTELLKINDTCAICLEKFNVGNKIQTLLCKHFFHEDCIELWSRKFCPLCRHKYEM